MRILLIGLLIHSSSASVSGFDQSADQAAASNPIRKVVTMLQAMQKKVAAEGEKEKELYEKFMCYCKNSGGDLQKSIAEAEAKVPNVGSDIEESEAKLKQDKEDLKKAQSDRAEAKKAMAEATEIREKEAAAFAEEKAELDANINSLTSAVNAIEKGMVGFLQTKDAQILRQVALNNKDLTDFDREELVSFLSGSSNGEYAPKSGEIVGILKEMKDTMSKSLADSTSEEAEAVNSYNELMAAKAKEVQALTKTIEAKTVRIGELAVSIVQMKEDLSDTAAALLEDKKFLADMDKNCATKTSEYEANQKTRADELVALAETIKVLNDDDALELFKKTLPSASASFVQMKVSATNQKTRALAKIAEARKFESHPRPGLDFLALALQGKKINFDKVIKMIDEMVGTLKTEQQDDDDKKEYCNKQFDFADDKKKGLEHSISDLEAAIAHQEESIGALLEDLKALNAGIKALDKSVQEATEQRKEENEDFTELMSSDAAAKELLNFAKNRLNKFYNPKLYKPPPKRVLSEEQRITVNMGGTLAPTAAPGGIAGTGVTVLADVAAHRQSKVAPPPPPATAAAYAKKSEESNGVIGMIDLLIKDLDKEMTEAETAEKDAQSDYEKAMNDAAEKRALDSKTLTDKEKAKADTEAELEKSKEEKASTVKEHMATQKYIASLHSECDWVIQYYDVRKEARAGEIESLKSAKAILSGADFGFLQVKGKSFMGRQ
jgi:hypothetical protein